MNSLNPAVMSSTIILKNAFDTSEVYVNLLRLKWVCTLNESPIGFEGQMFSKAYVVALPGTLVLVSLICLISVEVEISLIITPG